MLVTLFYDSWEGLKMSFFEYGDEDMASAAQSCKLFKPNSSFKTGALSDGISCGICSSWNGSRCSKRVLDNTLSGPELE